MTNLLIILAALLVTTVLDDHMELIKDKFRRSYMALLPPSVRDWLENGYENRFEGQDPRNQPRRMLGIPLAGHWLSGPFQIVISGWHSFKAVKLCLYGAAFFAVAGYTAWWEVVAGAALYGFLSGCVHEVLYGRMLLRPKRRKEHA